MSMDLIITGLIQRSWLGPPVQARHTCHNTCNVTRLNFSEIAMSTMEPPETQIYLAYLELLSVHVAVSEHSSKSHI